MISGLACPGCRVVEVVVHVVHRLQPDDGPRSSLGIRSGSDDVVEPRWEFARRFAKGIRKLAGNTLGDHRKKTIGLTVRMLEVAELGGTDKPPASDGWTTRTLEIGRRPATVDG
ncbi:hypothetical protein GW17_00044076 [Ensete ventricosum]|nr:hypothetical protein GW17_00044076 [Ensete ventricosum]